MTSNTSTTSFPVLKDPKFSSSKLVRFRNEWKNFVEVHKFKDDYTRSYAVAVITLISKGFELMIVNEIKNIMKLKDLNWMNANEHQFWNDFAYQGKRFRLKCVYKSPGHNTFTLNKSIGNGFEGKQIGTALTEDVKNMDIEKFVIRLLEGCAKKIFLANPEDTDEDNNFKNSGRRL